MRARPLSDNGISDNSIVSKIKYKVKKAYLYFYDKKIRQFKAIDIGLKYDSFKIQTKLGGSMKILQTPYFFGGVNLELLNKVKTVNKTSNKKIRIMVGHSAFPFLSHKEVLNKLQKYKKGNFLISLVVSYGNENYRNEIIAYGESIFGDKIEIVNDFMLIEDYLYFLNTLDIAVFDHVHQSALDNIFYLLYLNKKLVSNKNGIIAQALDLEKIEFNTTEELGIISLVDILSDDDDYNENGMKFASQHLDTEIIQGKWKDTFYELEQL